MSASTLELTFGFRDLDSTVYQIPQISRQIRVLIHPAHISVFPKDLIGKVAKPRLVAGLEQKSWALS